MMFKVVLNAHHHVCLWLWYLMSLSTIFQLYHGGQLYWWKKQECLPTTTDLSLLKTCLIILYRVLWIEGQAVPAPLAAPIV